MKKTLLLILSFFIDQASAQDLAQVSNQVLQEGIELYRNERASWISTDSLSVRDRLLVHGYFTYRDGEIFQSIYVDSTEQRAAFKFFFEPTDTLDIKLVKTEYDVPLTELQQQLFKIRKKALAIAEVYYQTLGYLEIVNPNIIIHRYSPQFEVFVIPGAKVNGLLPIGGDYLLTFKPNGELNKVDFIHNNLIPFNTKTPDGMEFQGHEHKGKRHSKEYMTSTDICTILLYRDYLTLDKHQTIHKKFISEFYFNEPRLLIRPNTDKLKVK